MDLDDEEDFAQAEEVRAEAEALKKQAATMAEAGGDRPPAQGVGSLIGAAPAVVPAMAIPSVPSMGNRVAAPAPSRLQPGFVPTVDLQQPTKLDSILDAFAGLQVPETPEFLAPPSAPTPRAGTGTVNPQLLQQLMGLLSAGQQPVQPPQTLGQIIGRGRR
jgi:hypothetical protein